MLTETITLDNKDNSWRSIVNTTTSITIADMTGPIRVRFGISSASDGIPMESGDILTAEETIYLQPIISKTSNYTRSGKQNLHNTKVYINRN